MQYISGNGFRLRDTAVTLGKFDGIHLGHQLLLRQVLGRRDLSSLLFTFDLHPGNLFSDQEIRLISTQKEKIRFLADTGLSYLIAFPFTKETAGLDPRVFIQQILVDRLGARLVVVGEDFHFGRGRSGSVELLREMAGELGFEVVSFPKLVVDGGVVSSTRIRSCIEKGEMEAAARLLGRPFSFLGTVVHGNQLGRTVGMPTANLRPGAEKLLPPNGVYAADILVEGRKYRGITNVGFKPTVGGETAPGVETWIFDFEQDLYGQEIEVQLLGFIRPERKFGSLAAVKQQVELDAQKARAWVFGC